MTLSLFLTLFWVGMTLLASAVVLATLAGFLGKVWWVLDLASHFRLQYFLALIISTLVFLSGRRYSAAMISGMFALVNFALILPLYLPDRSHRKNGTTYRAISANLLRLNHNYPAVHRLVESVDPDFFVFLEGNQTWLDQLDSIRSRYPYTINLPLEDNYGVALFSRIPFKAAEIRGFGPSERATVVARLALDGKLLTVIGTHPPPPKSQLESFQRDQQLVEIAAFAAEQETPVLLMGDFNMSSWSPTFAEILKKSGLRDSRVGFGIQPSWPVTNLLLFVPIDHVLVSPQIDVRRRWTGSKIGSDHLPVIIEFSLG